jgi:flagellar motor protein MotB
MARKKKHEDHVNAEAWAIPYGDLVTLLFALFTVMYAMSSVNEGKFRVLSDSMIAAFHGAPKSLQPINIGEKESGKGGDKPLVGVSPTALLKIKAPVSGINLAPQDPSAGTGRTPDEIPGALIRMERQVQDAMQALIDAKLVTVRRENLWLEIEINTDILFPSGAGAFAAEAAPVLDKLPIRSASKDTPTIAPSEPKLSPRIGSCPRRARRASCTSSPKPASIRCGWRSSASASFIRANPMTRSKVAMRIGALRSWCWRKLRPVHR